MWNIFTNEDLSLHTEKKEDKNFQKKKGKKKLPELVGHKNSLTSSNPHGSSFTKNDNKKLNKAYDIKIRELRKNFRKKYRIVRTQLLKIIKIVKQFPEIDVSEEKSRKDEVQNNDKRECKNNGNVENTNIDNNISKKKKEIGKEFHNGSDSQVVMVQVELIKKLNKIMEKIDIEQLKAKKKVKTKQNNKTKNEEERLKNNLVTQNFTNKPFVIATKNDSHKSSINVMKKIPKRNFLLKSTNNFHNVNQQHVHENARREALLYNDQINLRNDYYQNSMNFHSKKQTIGDIYHDTDDMVVTDFYMYSSTLNANSIKKKNKSQWFRGNFNNVPANDNNNGYDISSTCAYGGNSYNYGGSNYGYSFGNYRHDSGNYDIPNGNYGYTGSTYNYSYEDHNYNSVNYASCTYCSGNYNGFNYSYEKNSSLKEKGKSFSANNNNEIGIPNKGFFNHMVSSCTQKYNMGEDGMGTNYDFQNSPCVMHGHYSQYKNKKINLNNKKKGYKFAKDEKIRGLLRTAKNEDDLVKAIGFAKNAGLYFEAKLGNKKLSKLKLEGEDEVPSDV
ncbi:hypothetical protein, conserved [Plasmodium gonderi]|uniref:Uncharacterized protein n=1 Tax=Plasmodium gonderi TaxID=77519 RepID=A0A1Y1JAX5_PLAGO|nr:hypothetical protein, conserved [Plasmodium gonderi]GAW79646.1 hypothetical protein, conserved [Plasmodium gonderi]